ncbi:MAG: hypothetical protein AABX88_02355, partial [Nanoarchaeota archaeon]
MNRKRVVFKKGRYVTTMEGDFVIKLSKKIYDLLKPFSKKIMIAGSIRRENLNPVDIDIVLIPKDKKPLRGCSSNTLKGINAVASHNISTSPNTNPRSDLHSAPNTKQVRTLADAVASHKEKIIEILGKKGKFMQGGEKRSAFKIEGVKVEIYYTNEKSWGATLLA